MHTQQEGKRNSFIPGPPFSLRLSSLRVMYFCLQKVLYARGKPSVIEQGFSAFLQRKTVRCEVAGPAPTIAVSTDLHAGLHSDSLSVAVLVDDELPFVVLVFRLRRKDNPVAGRAQVGLDFVHSLGDVHFENLEKNPVKSALATLSGRLILTVQGRLQQALRFFSGMWFRSGTLTESRPKTSLNRSPSFFRISFMYCSG